MVPSAPVNLRDSKLLRLLATLGVVLGLAAGAAACSSGNAEVVGVVETTTTTAPDPYVTVVATAKGPEIEVLAELPEGTDAPASSPTTTAPATTGVQPIPRFGLNSAGSAKTEVGWTFENPTYFDNPLVMVVTETSGDWLRVQVHARPNGMEGWVRADDVELSSHSYRMELDLAGFDLKVYDGEELIEQTQVVIGKDATPTPVGTYFLNEMIPQSNPGGASAPGSCRPAPTARPSRPSTVACRSSPSTAPTSPISSARRPRTDASGCPTTSSPGWPRPSRQAPR